MPRPKKTWGEKMKAKPPHHVILDKDFAGIPKGSKLHISCPIEVAAELKTITPGSTMSILIWSPKNGHHKVYYFLTLWRLYEEVNTRPAVHR